MDHNRSNNSWPCPSLIRSASPRLDSREERTQGAALSDAHADAHDTARTRTRNALNTIVVVFNGRRDSKIRDCWHKLIEHVYADQTRPGWNERYFDLKTDLLREIGLRVRYDFSTDYLKRQAYNPMAYGAEADNLLVRTMLTKVLTPDGLKVQLIQSSENSNPSERKAS
jgi:hypothetical protein